MARGSSLVPSAILLLAAAGCAVITAVAVRHTFDAFAAAGVRHVFVGPRDQLERRGAGLRICAAPACRARLWSAAARALRANAWSLRVALFSWIVWLIFVASTRGVRDGAPLSGSARYASRKELRTLRTSRSGAWFPLGYLPPSGIARWLLRFPAARRPAAALVGPPVRLPADDLDRHVLVLGLTGSHKTTAVVFPALLEAARRGLSVVALDLKYGETDSLARAATEWQRRDRDVLVFAPLDRATLRWNPLDRCRTIGDAYHVAALLFDDIDPSNLDALYWLGAERHVCAVLGYALTTGGDEGTLARLRALCASGPAAVQAYIRSHPAAGMLVPSLGAFHAMMPKDQAGILQGIASRLEAWGDEAVAAATGSAPKWQQVDLARMRREPALLIVGVPQAALGRLRWLCHIFLKDLASCLLKPRAPDEPVRVLLVLEELATWGALPGLAEHLATYRSRRVSVLATLQSEAQGEHVYGRSGWPAVAANLVTKLYLPSLGDPDADRLSRALGTTVGEDVARSRGWGSSGTRTGEQRRPIPIPLARPEDLRGPGRPPDEILIRFSRLPPARLWCPPYFLRPEYDGDVPESRITTAELAVYHHLRRIPMDARPRRLPDRDVRVAAPAPATPPVAPAGRSIPFVHPPPAGADLKASPRALSARSVEIEPDAADLNRLIARLMAQSLHAPVLRCVRSGDRVMEVRLHPDAVVEACGGPAAMQALARRWSARKWVRRVRPVFVLTRRALDALDRDLSLTLNQMATGETVARESVAEGTPSDSITG